jgi:hypothetical protein
MLAADRVKICHNGHLLYQYSKFSLHSYFPIIINIIMMMIIIILLLFDVR